MVRLVGRCWPSARSLSRLRTRTLRSPKVTLRASVQPDISELPAIARAAGALVRRKLRLTSLLRPACARTRADSWKARDEVKLSRCRRERRATSASPTGRAQSAKTSHGAPRLGPSWPLPTAPSRCVSFEAVGSGCCWQLALESWRTERPATGEREHAKAAGSPTCSLRRSRAAS